jgi:GNAT superfamily N-acetyltransferase
MPQRPLEARGAVAADATADAGDAAVALRLATVDDIPALLDVINPAYRRVDGHIFPQGTRMDGNDARRAIETAGSRIVVAEVDGEIAGCIQVVLAERAEFGPLATAIAHQRRGIASALIAHAEEVARDAGYRTMRLHAIEEVGWRSFYESLGYGVVDRVASDAIPGVETWGAARPFTMLRMEKAL